MRYGMLIDLKRCIGCYGCQLLCKAENATPPGILWSWVIFHEAGRYPDVRKIHLPLLCMHCEFAPCVEACPTGATIRRPDGIVTIDHTKCIGCRSCIIACPYGARSFHGKESEYFPGQGLTPYEKAGFRKHPTGVVEKCNFCLPRIERGLEPACVAGCMAKARYFGDLDNPNSEVSRLIQQYSGFQIQPEMHTNPNPSVYYIL